MQLDKNDIKEIREMFEDIRKAFNSLNKDLKNIKARYNKLFPYNKISK